MTGQHEYAVIERRLISLLEKIVGSELGQPISYTGPGSVRQLGLTSVQLLKLLVDIENEFGVVWEEDLDESVISTIDEMVRYISSVTSGSSV